MSGRGQFVRQTHWPGPGWFYLPYTIPLQWVKGLAHDSRAFQSYSHCTHTIDPIISQWFATYPPPESLNSPTLSDLLRTGEYFVNSHRHSVDPEDRAKSPETPSNNSYSTCLPACSKYVSDISGYFCYFLPACLETPIKSFQIKILSVTSFVNQCPGLLIHIWQKTLEVRFLLDSISCMFPYEYLCLCCPCIGRKSFLHRQSLKGESISL